MSDSKKTVDRFVAPVGRTQNASTARKKTPRCRAKSKEIGMRGSKNSRRNKRIEW